MRMQTRHARQLLLALLLSSALVLFAAPSTCHAGSTSEASLTPAADSDWLAPAVAATAPDVVAEAAVVMERRTGQVLYTKNATLPYYPASLTKILTADLLLAHAEPDEILTASGAAVAVEPSTLYLREGEQITARNALAALFLQSANDVANVVAEHVAGSTAAFAALMNERAREMGAQNAHFTNPHGLHDPEHVVTALDMAQIARAALNAHPEIEAIARTAEVDLNRDVEPKVLVNKNQLLTEVDGAYGLKNGFTEQAGYTYIGAARRGDLDLLVVLLKSPSAVYYEDAARLLEWAFANFSVYTVVHSGQVLGTMEVWRGDGPTDLIAAADLQVVAPTAAAPKPDAVLNVNTQLQAPLAADTAVGAYEGTVAGVTFRVPVRTAGAIGLVWWTEWLRCWWLYLAAALLLWLGRNCIRLRRYERRLAQATAAEQDVQDALAVLALDAAGRAAGAGTGAASGAAAAPQRGYRSLHFRPDRSPIWEINDSPDRF